MTSANLVIANLEPRLVELPDVTPKVIDGKVAEVGYMAARLLPGENDVPEAYWDRVVKNPCVKILLAAGTIKNRGAGKAKALLAAGLDNLPGDLARRHVGNCESVKVLNDWLSNTESLPLRKLIEERKLELVHSQDGSVERSPALPGAVEVEPVVEPTLSTE